MHGKSVNRSGIYKLVIACVSFCLLCSLYIFREEIYLFFHDPAMVEYANDVSKNSQLKFSVPPGFYSDPFQLEITAPTDEIYYTLDGTDPDRNSMRYTGPLKITDVTSNENVHSARTDVTAGFLLDLLDEYSFRPSLINVVPDFPVDKCTIIRAVYYDAEGEQSPVETGSYFVGYDRKDGYENMHVLSIVSDPKNFFDYDTGIYVLGKRFERFLDEGGLDGVEGPIWNWWTGNFSCYGREWERLVSLQFFDPDGNMILSQEGGIRIHGGGTRGSVPRSFNIYARTEYDGNTVLHHDFFQTGFEPDKVILSSGGDDRYSKLKDPLGAVLCQKLDFSTMRHVPYLLFLDGEYWGVYYLTEKFDTRYVSQHYNISQSNIVIIKNGELDEGEEDDLALFTDAMTFLSGADMTEDANYKKACEILDMESFTDYFCAEIYIARASDWPQSNYALWRSRRKGVGKYEDGKWRWMLFDLNTDSMSMSGMDENMIDRTRKWNAVFNNLCNSQQFRQLAADKLVQLSQTVFAPVAVDTVLDGLIAGTEEAMAVHFRRFYGTSDELFYETAEDIRMFFKERPEVIKNMIRESFPDVRLASE